MTIFNILGDLDPMSSGYRTGQVIPIAIFFLFILKVFSISRRPTASPRAAWGLILVLFGWILTIAAEIMMRMSLAYRVAATILVFVIVLVMIAGIVLAIFGLIESRKQRDRFTQGTTQSVWSFVLGGLALLLFCVGFAIGITRMIRNQSENPLASAMPLPAATTAGDLVLPIRFDDLNFAFDPLQRPWVRTDPQHINPGACLAFSRGVPDMTFIVFAEQIGMDQTSDVLADISIAKLKSASDQCEVEDRQPLSVNGIDGIRMYARAQIHGINLCYVYWVASVHGYLYQLVTIGLPTNESDIENESEKIWQHFRLVDYVRHATPAAATGLPLTDFRSDDFGVSMNLAGLGWHAAPEIEKTAPSALLCGQRSSTTFFVLFGYQLDDLNPPMDYLARAFLKVHGLSYNDAHNIQDSSYGVFDTRTFEMQFTRGGNKQLGIFKIIRKPGFVYALQSDTTVPSDLDYLKALPDTIHPDPGFIGGTAVLQKYQASHKLLLNALGMEFENNKQFVDAANYFSKAFEMAPDATVLSNLIISNQSAGKYLDALLAVNRGLTLWPDQVGLLARRAKLQLLLNNPTAAIDSLHTLFATDYRDDDAFHEYLLLLQKQKKTDDAITASIAYLAKFDSESIGIDLATLYDIKGQHDQAIDTMRKLHQNDASNSVVTVNFATVLIHARKYDQALELAQDLVNSKNDDGLTYVLMGEAQFGLGWYRQAKESFESALAKSPDEPGLQKWIDATSAKLGEGDNSSIKSPIDPVAIPASILAGAAHATPAPDPAQDAWYQARIKAISFEPGTQMKTSEYQLVQVFNQRGVDNFSKLTFPFDSLAEKIYLNKLQVRDAQGKVVATTGVDHCFVTDEEQAQEHSFRKQLNVPVEGLKANYTIECQVTRMDISPPDKVRFTFSLLGAAFPGSVGGVYLAGKMDLINCVTSAGLKAQKVGEGLYWSVSPLPQYRSESQQPLVDTFLPFVAVGPKGETWDSVGKDYLNTISPNLAEDATVASVAQQLTQGLTTDAQKVTAIVRYVQHDYRYTAIEFGRRARIPDKAADIIHNKCGDCKDHALLAKELLDSVGIPAELVLANFDQTIQPALPSLDQFTHMIVYVPSQKKNGFFDCTDKYSDIHFGVPIGLARHDVLLLDAKEPRLIQVPEYPQGAYTVDCTRSISLTDAGAASIAEDVSMEGPEAAGFRYFFDAIAPGERLNQMQEFLSGRGAQVMMHDLKIENLDDATLPLKMKLSYTLSNCLGIAGKEMVGSVPALMGRYLISPALEDHRFTPFEYRFPIHLTWSDRLSLPDGFALENVPSDGNISDSYTHESAQYHSDQHSLSSTIVFDSKPFIHPANDYPALESSRKKVLDSMERQMRLIKR